MMEKLSKLSIEDLRKLQKELLEEFSRRDTEAWNIAADNFKKAFDELMRIGLGAPQVMVDITYKVKEYDTIGYTEINDLRIDKENKIITLEAERVYI